MTGHLHRHAFRDAGSDEIADGGSANAITLVVLDAAGRVVHRPQTH